MRRADGGGSRPGAMPGRGRGDGPAAVRALRDVVNGLVQRPEVLGKISPGFYFQRCLEIWRPDLHEIDRERKAQAVEPLEGRGAAKVVGDPLLYRALLDRQAATLAALGERCSGIEWRLRSIAPFVTGIGSPHPLENGFAFLKPYGVPYVAGSGLKGAVRASCTAVWREQRGRERTLELLKHHFGSDDKNPPRGDAAGHARGALVFFDLFPETGSNAGKDARSIFRLDVVNPHYGPYYQGKDVPADWHSPLPSYFLTLRADLEWRLRIIYAPPRGEQPHEAWVDEIGPGLERALTESGVGAKKAWGYGLFAVVSRRSWRAGDKTQADVHRAGDAQHETPPAVHRETRPAPPVASQAARSLRSMLPGLRAYTVKPSLAALEQHLREARVEERVELLGAIEHRLVELRLQRKDMNAIMSRLRALVVPPSE